jgi:peptide/nickel transport system permease protein
VSTLGTAAARIGSGLVPGVDATAAERLQRRALSEHRWTRRTLAIGATMVLLVPLAAIVVQVFGLLPGPQVKDFDAILQAPSLQHPFGTDQLGRDVLSRVLAATWLDYGLALVLAYVPMMVGIVLGAAAGYFGGAVDAVIMRLADLVLAFPFMVLILAVITVVGPGLWGLVIGALIIFWAFNARLTRAEMLVLREQQYMAAAKTLGLPTRRILLVHALPNLLRPNLVTTMSTIVINITLVAGLSYLGLGIQPPTPEWGAIVSEGQELLFTHWWLATLPGLVIVWAGIGFCLLGDGLADRFGVDYQAGGL